jgi:hypothetical protein
MAAGRFIDRPHRTVVEPTQHQETLASCFFYFSDMRCARRKLTGSAVSQGGRQRGSGLDAMDGLDAQPDGVTP